MQVILADSVCQRVVVKNGCVNLVCVAIFNIFGLIFIIMDSLVIVCVSFCLFYLSRFVGSLLYVFLSNVYFL